MPNITVYTVIILNMKKVINSCTLHSVISGNFQSKNFPDFQIEYKLKFDNA